MEKVRNPYVEGRMRSAVILDRIESHIHPYFTDTIDELGTKIITISGSFTSLCEPCNIGIIRPFKKGFNA